MNCPACAHDNRAGAKFCEECAASLPRRCAGCGAELRPTAKFCDECGAPALAAGAGTPAPSPQSAARKVVTIIFADLVGSTALHERLDPESVRHFMASYYAAMRGAVEAHGGRVTQVMGDGVKAVFGAPRVAEDDAIRAVRAGVAMQQAFRALAAEQRDRVGTTGLRVAVNSGEVVADEATEIIGDPVNVAARLQEQGRDGDVVVGGATQRLVSSLVTLELLGTFMLKGRAEAVKAYRVVSLERPAMATAAVFVGRDEELARLTAVYAGAVAAPAARLAVLLGSPGLGKSRLIDEVGRRLAGAATVVAARCDPAGGGTFAPVSAALRQHLAVDAAAGADALRAAVEAALPPNDADRARIAGGVAALLAGSPAPPQETFYVVRRLLTSIAAAQPLLLVIDDLQWAEPLLLDLVEHLIQWGSGVPMLVLVGARPELRALRSSLATPGGLVADVVTLAGLDAGAATRLAANVIGAADLPAAVAAKVLATSEGNPLFVAELVRMLVQEGALTREGERWTVGAGLAGLEMPPTIHALLAARLERLRPEDRAVLERAAVVGRHFSRNAVAALHEASDLDERLEALKRGELIEPDSGWFLGEPGLRFHHVLIRDAAYRRLLKGTRAELHGRFADWVEARAGAADHDETIGWHLEQAHQLLREIGPLDAAGRALGERAAQHLAAAGRRALARDDLPVAADLLGRAVDRLDGDDAARAELALDWCEALLSAGDVGRAAAAIAELGRFAGAGADDRTDQSDPPDPPAARLRAWHTCFTTQLTVLTASQGLQPAAEAVAAAAQQLGAHGDAAGEAKAHQVHALALARLGRVGACEAALDKALAAARQAGDRRRANAVLAGAPLAALWGPSPVTRASGRCLDVVRVLRITQGAPAVEAVALSCQGVLEALRGRTDAARRMIAASRKMVEELGITHRLLEADAFAGRIDLLEGDAAAAERSLRGAYEGLRDLGLGIDAAQAAALLARALLAQGRAAEAEALSRDSEALAGDDLQAAIAWRGVRAEALAQRGEHAAAVELAQAAVAIAAATDALLDHADARLALAAALRAAGRGGDADAEQRRAVELWEAKGATLLAERVRGEVGRGASAQVSEARAEPTRRAPRRVRANAATALTAAFDAAFVSGNIAAIEAIFVNAGGLRVVDHPTESSYGRAGAVESYRRLLRFTDPIVRHEPLAALGASLGLFRRRISAGGTTGARFDVAGFEREEFVVSEPDVMVEIFAGDRLGDAIASLFARYAGQLPEASARQRATVTAGAIAAMVAPPDLDRYAAALAPSVEFQDHRTVGFASGRGVTTLLRGFRSLMELAADVATRVDDIVRLEPDAILLRWTTSGTDRRGGGAFESPFLLLWVFGAEGLIIRDETFDVGREDEALARFDALTAEAPLRTVRRYLRPNAATAVLARMEAAFGARDLAAVDALLGEVVESIDHGTGTVYGRAGQLDSSRRMMRLPGLVFRLEPLATLGDRLCLFRRRVTASGTAGGNFDVAAYEMDHVVLVEIDATDCCHFVETFAADRLGDAIARLYARHAARLPDGPARARAATTARAAAAMLTRSTDDRLEDVMVPDLQVVDSRTVGVGPVRGADVLSRWRAASDELAQDETFRVDDVLALGADALLRRTTQSGTVRASGGAFETSSWALSVFGLDGRQTRFELFDVGREAEALARFDQVVGRRPPEAANRLFANAATPFRERIDAAWRARDWAGLAALLASDYRCSDRRRLVQVELGREGWVEMTRRLGAMGSARVETEVLATRGNRLALWRVRIDVADGDVGPSHVEHLNVHEVNAAGDHLIAGVRFDADDLDAAYAELDGRFAADPDAPHARLAIGVVGGIARRDWEAVGGLCNPAFVQVDHRRLAMLGTTCGGEAWVQNFRALAELAPDSTYRAEHVRSAPHGVVVVGIWQGTREGGSFEIPNVVVMEVDEGGALARTDVYEPDQLDQALARFDALQAASVASPQRFINAATATVGPVIACLVAHDWQGFTQLFADDFLMSDRRRVVQLELDREQYVAFTREVADGRAIRAHSTVLATRGERLALTLPTYEFADADVGPSEIAFLILTEVDERGRIVAYVRWDVEDLDAAYAELDARWAAGEGAVHRRAAQFLIDYQRCFAARDWAGMAAIMAPGLVSQSHRLVSWGTVHGPAGLVATMQAQMELAPDTQARIDHVRASGGGLLLEFTWRGTRDGGAFENVVVATVELAASGRARRIDVWEAEQLDAALVCFEALLPQSSDTPLAP